MKIIEGKNNFQCKDSASVASIVFHGNIEQITGSRRVKFLRDLSKQFESGINDFKVEYGNRMDGHEMLTSDLKMAGPGDVSSKIIGEQPGFTVSWKLACGSNIEGLFCFCFFIFKIVCKSREFSTISYFNPIFGNALTQFVFNRNVFDNF